MIHQKPKTSYETRISRKQSPEIKFSNENFGGSICNASYVTFNMSTTTYDVHLFSSYLFSLHRLTLQWLLCVFVFMLFFFYHRSSVFSVQANFIDKQIFLIISAKSKELIFQSRQSFIAKTDKIKRNSANIRTSNYTE